MEERLVMYLIGVPLLGIAAQWLAWRLRLPAILLLLGCGIVLGQFVDPDQLLSEVTGGARANGPRLLFPVVSLAVAVILFEGGLSLRFHELKYSGPVVLRLVTIGAAATWLLTTIAARYAFDLSTRVALLVGAILVVTGPTVVGPLLRHIRPTRRVSSIAKWEGIVIDPIGAVLAVLVFEQLLAATHIPTFTGVSLALLRCAAVALILGYLVARLLVEAVRRYWLPDYLQGVSFLAAALGAYAASNALQAESGLATVTLMGIVLANQRKISVLHVTEFNEHVGVLLVSCLFVVLGSRLNLDEITALGIGGGLFLFLLIVVVRPISVLAATIGTATPYRERLFLAFLAPRGIVAAAVASVFALKLATVAGEERQLAQQAQQLVPITFLAILGTVTVYGLFAAPLARRLRLADPNPQGLLIAGASQWVVEMAKALKDEGIAVLLLDTNDSHVRHARMRGLAAECMNVLSESVQNELDLSGIGRLLAMTPNEEVNALAARELLRLFGRENVYQLANSSGGSPRRAVPPHLGGRPLFGKKMTYQEIEDRFEHGAAVKKTKLSIEFTWQDFRRVHGTTSTPLFVLTDTKSLSICSANHLLEPKPGQTVVALVDTKDNVLQSADDR
ncbi:MAG: sodium:proton antiporter [Pirellulales bacterium]|nr:sodium:proton antiporter [Pirellulales bacterium]